MIPYEELVSALAMWRERNGLPVGAADYLGEPPAPEPVSFAAYESRPITGDDVVEDIPMSDDFAADEIGDEIAGEIAAQRAAIDAALDEPGEVPASADEWPASADEWPAAAAVADDFDDAPPIDPSLAEPAPEDETVDPWAGADQPEVAEAVDMSAYDDYPPVTDETLHDPNPQVDDLAADYPGFESPPAHEDVSFEAEAMDESLLGETAEPSTVDDDVAVVTDQPPVNDVGDSTEPVDPVELAEAATRAPVDGEIETTLVGFEAPETHEPE